MDECGVGGHADVAAFDEFDDLVLLAVVLQFHLLGVHVHGGFGVVVDVHVHLVAHLTCDAEVDLLVEVEAEGLPSVGSQRGVLDVLVGAAQLQLGVALCLDLHASGAENLLCWSEVELDVCEVELALAAGVEGVLVLLAVVLLHGALEAPLLVLVGRHEDGR